MTATGRELPLEYGGFRYTCTVWEQPDAVLLPLVVLPGVAENTRTYGGFQRRMGRWATCVGIDLPGVGDSDPLPSVYGPEFLAGAVHHAITELGLGPVNLCGSSAGSALAYLTALHHPGDIARVALVGVAPELPAHLAEGAEELVAAMRADPARRAEWVELMVSSWVCQDPERRVRGRRQVTQAVRAGLTGAPAGQLDANLENYLRAARYGSWFPGRGLRQPVLVFTGEHDTVTPPERGRAVAAWCADARFTTVRDADHLVHLERGADVIDLLVRFCSDSSLEGLDYCSTVEYFGSARPSTAPSTTLSTTLSTTPMTVPQQAGAATSSSGREAASARA